MTAIHLKHADACNSVVIKTYHATVITHLFLIIASLAKQSKQSAGILVYRTHEGVTEIFLVHPGGPFWAKKDLGAWTIPKGEFTDEEPAIEAAKREFHEETGILIPWNDAQLKPLQPVKLKSGKTVHAWACSFDFGSADIKSNTFPLEWPPRSGKMMEIPEIDKGAWFTYEEAQIKVNQGQLAFIEELRHLVEK